MRLSLPDGQLSVVEGTFAFRWSGFGGVDALMAQCVSVSIRTHGHDNGAQIIFHFRPGEQGEPGRIMVRVDIPSSHVSYASQYVADLQQAYGLKDSTAEAPEDESLRRVPCDSDGWLAVPESVQSAELYEEIFDRIAAVPAP